MAASLEFPARLAGLAMRPLPAAALRPLLDLGLALVTRRHPNLIERLKAMAPAKVIIEPADLPHRFLLALAEDGVRLSLAGPEDEAVATVRGTLASLIDLMEGRIDGDTLFFNRALTVTGDTTIVVALRNIFDGADLDIVADVLSFLGPFARPAGRAIAALDDFAKRVEREIKAFHDAQHGRDVEAEQDRLKGELADLKARLARLESRRPGAGSGA